MYQVKAKTCGMPWPVRAWTIMVHTEYSTVHRDVHATHTCAALKEAHERTLSIKCQPQTQAPLAAALRPERLPKEGGRRWGKWLERSLRLRRGARSHQQERGEEEEAAAGQYS